MNYVVASFVLFLSVMLAGMAAAQEQVAPDQLSQIERDIELTEQRRAELRAEVEAHVAASQEISRKLLALTDRYEQAEQEVRRSEAKLKELRQEEVLIRADVEAKRDVLSRVLAGLQRLEQNPPPALVVAPDDVLGALRGAMMFGAVVPELKDEALELSRKLERLQKLRSETVSLQARAAEQRSIFAADQAQLQSLAAEKKRLAAQAQIGVSDADQRLQGLAREAKSLKELMTAIERERQRAAEALSAKEAAEEKARLVEEERLRAKSRLAMADAKGKLEYPLQGTILRRFGEDNGFGAPLSGLVIGAEPGAVVRTPVAGKIQFAGPFRTLSQVIIIDAGQDYVILLAGFARLSVATGQWLEMGEPVGHMGEDRASVSFIDFGKDAGNAVKKPILYVEFRKDGAPVDSTEWWTGNRKEAQR